MITIMYPRTNFSSTVLILMLWFSAASFTITSVLAQIFPDYPIPVNWPGISDECEAALNTTLACSGLLGYISEKRLVGFSFSVYISVQHGWRELISYSSDKLGFFHVLIPKISPVYAQTLVRIPSMQQSR